MCSSDLSRTDGGNLRLNGNTLSPTNTNGNLILAANGTGIVNVTSAMSTIGQTVTGVLSVTGQLNADNLRLDGNVLSSTNANGDVNIVPNGTGWVRANTITPFTSGNLGDPTLKWDRLYLDFAISDGSVEVGVPILLRLRDIEVGVATGMTIFWNGVKWVASYPDTEVDHGTISGLLDDDHTQYALLAGRAGGQSLVGGSAASNNLNFESTSNATKGFVQTKDTFRAFTDASFSGGWSGADLGGSGNRFRHLYTAGEAFGLRLENVGANPSPSTQNVGRLVYNTSEKEAYIDTGTSFKKLSYSKFLSDTSWNGSDVTKTVTVSGDIDDARRAMWALHDNTNDFDRIYCSIKAISSTQVTITVGSALPAGSYRLIGIE